MEDEETLFEVARSPVVAVIGAGDAPPEQARIARRIGRMLAEAGVTLVTGGRGGVMEAASRGAALSGGLVIGILPGGNASETPPNPYVQVPIYTGIGEARNAVVVRSAGAVIAIGGGYGTLAEIGFALKAGRHVILMGSWEVRPPAPAPGFDALLRTAQTPQEAVALAVALAGAALEEARETPGGAEPGAASAAPGAHTGNVQEAPGAAGGPGPHRPGESA